MKKPIDYNKYEFSLKEWIESVFIGIFLIALVSYLFYSSLFPFFILSPSIIFIIIDYKRKLINKRKGLLNFQFKDGIMALSASLSTGYAIENAFCEAYTEVSILYGEDSYISREFSHLLQQIQINITVEDALEGLGKRSGLEDIENFAQIFKIAKRSGGDLIEVIHSTSETIGQKIDTKREIFTIISAKKYEQKIMNVIPFGIIIYIKITNVGFLDIMYTTIMGKLIMTFCLVLYGIAYKISEKIVSIEI